MSGEADVLLKVEVSPDGTLRATALNPDDPRAVMLADFIEGGVQASDNMARLLLDELSTVERGEVNRVETGGNAYSVTIDSDSILIEINAPDFEDWPSYRYRHDEYHRALEQVLAVLEERGRTGKAAAA